MPSDTQTLPPPFVTLVSEYWSQDTPDVLRQKIQIRRRMAAGPQAQMEIVKAISQERLEFKILWNRSLPVNQLPFELLLRVFAFSSDHFAISSTPRWLWPPAIRFWTLMAVCRHWRELIVNTWTIWCALDLRGNARWTELCLARSATAPISVDVRVEKRYDLYSLNAAYPHVYHIRSLVFKVTSPGEDKECRDVVAALEVFFRTRMPILEDLYFSISDYERRYSFLFPVDIKLTSKCFPRLQCLTFARAVAPRDPSLYTQLRALSLTACTHSLSFDSFLDVLDSCACLTDLHLEDTLHRLSDGDWMQRDPSSRQRPLISIPHLDSLVLHAHGAVCTARFLAHLHIHPSARLEVSADAEDADADGPDGARSMVAMLPADPAVTLEPLATASTVHMTMSVASTARILTDYIPWDPPHVELQMRVRPLRPRGRLRHDDAPPSRWGAVGDLAALLGRSPVTSLRVSDVYPDTVAAWAAVFRAFPRLERLSVQASGTRPCEAGAVAIRNVLLGLHAASLPTAGPDPDSGSGSDPDPDPDRDPDPDPDGTVACPNLAYVDVDASRVEIAAVYEEMRTCFRFRRDRGVFLAELELYFDAWEASAKLCRACLKDIGDCTGRLSLNRVSFDEREEEDGRVELARTAEQSHVPDRDDGGQGAAATFDAETNGAWASQALEGRRIGLRGPFKNLRRLVLKKFRRTK